MKKFGNEFMMGAATAAHQVEGNNKNSDCWAMENVPYSMYKEPSLDAADHYSRYKEDINYLAEAGLNAYRFSIEWARIEPKKGVFDEAQINHYKDVLQYCHEKGVTPIVTLHHFSSPKWLISDGGWEDEGTVGRFETYCRYVVSELGELIPYICTINEANMGIQISKMMKRMMKRDSALAARNSEDTGVQVGLNVDIKERMQKYYIEIGKAFGIDPRNVNVFLAPRSEKGNEIIMRCHKRARAAIKEINPKIQVGITFSLYDHQAIPGGEANKKREQYEDFEQYIPYIQDDDFIGVQNYTRKVHGPDGIVEPGADVKMTDAGNEYYPESIGGAVRFIWDSIKKPIIVTENGISTTDDKLRVEFINAALNSLYDCVSEKIEVLGYMHWSLLDNFEWQKGYSQKFGLIAVDRETQKRYPKESLYVLGDIANKGLSS
jgi:beta-glucosidase